MPARTPEERSLVARIASAERWGRTPDRTAATAPARAGLRAKFAREVDPDGTLDPAEVDRRVDQLHRAHMLRMTLKAKAARRQARELTAQAEAAETELEAAGGPDAA
ncbi:hypothetical protein EV643_102455 [Kribbella sp. VKM Ac-2527]|uniref:Uncharacterized protein n=1 Tax=Kribbella caucasensis TaxID=2512215 RepID=A0A4R6KNN2_9ACTN|nr:hypothetical protein [Kribbella sp. VKM Ac-2527]TDO52616.1 hypothetical protein EV643_102455 [Kribbella sp. VKM Ac-2527]